MFSYRRFSWEQRANFHKKKTHGPGPARIDLILRMRQSFGELAPAHHLEGEVEMFQKWSAMDPVDDWECERARRIQKVQGNVNHFVDEACVKK